MHMATRKKAKKKASKKKKSKARRSPARKKVVRRPSKKKTAAKKKKPKAAAGARKPAAKAAARKVAAPAPKPAMIVPAGEERVGIVTHYFNHLSVAILKLETGNLRVGDTIHIKGHTSDFYQRVESMEIDHVHVNEARPGQSFGVKVKDHAREHDVVYKVAR
jgi:putative protease